MASIALRSYKIRPLQATRRLWRLVQSRELVLTVLITMTVVVTLGATIPQRGWFSANEYALWRAARPLFADIAETLGLSQVFTSWWFYALLGLAALSLATVTLKRAYRLLTAPAPTAAQWRWCEVESCRNGATAVVSGRQEEALEAAQGVLQERGYRVEIGEQLLYAHKGQVGTWGSVLFHLSFLLLLLGGVYSLLTRFDGWMVVTEGQTLADRSQDYVATSQSALTADRYKGFQLRLEKFVPTYQGRTGVDYSSYVTVKAPGQEDKQGVVRVNHPMSYDGATILGESYGFAPLLSIVDGSGSRILHAYTNLTVLSEGTQDMVKVPNSNLIVKVKMYPDLVETEEGWSSASFVPRRPALYVEMDDYRNEPAAGLVRLGESLQMGDLTLTFQDLRYWSRFRIIKDGGEALIFAAF
ncbi:MAG TPA: cytochrome c biogenesis protein ResB, partial [Dehalococcoidia bacterium]|nr:cytochrome c biogenesis protein ResB [Dehalococcoidia bacterium]